MARWVKLASICPEQDSSLDTKAKLIKKASYFIDRAAVDRPDLIALPEHYLAPPVHSPVVNPDEADTVGGPTIRAMARKARQHNAYICAPILDKNGKRFYNSVVLIDRKGKVVGAYRKNHPVICEVRRKISPGTEMPVFETDLGRIGFAICYDMNFQDVPERLHKNGAELVIFSSAWPASLILRARALLYNFWILSSVADGKGVLIDPLGRIIRRAWVNRSNPPHNGILSCRINTDCIPFDKEEIRAPCGH